MRAWQSRRAVPTQPQTHPPNPGEQGAGPMGAGDLLMSFLSVVIVSFGFRVYTQRDTMRRHFPEIMGATTLSSAFSLCSTAFGAKALGLSSGAWGDPAPAS